jgi:hypothetical protein
MRAVADEARGWFAVGTVTEIETHTALGYLLSIELQPSGRECMARLVGRRLLLPVAVGDEVLVAFPDGDPNRAIAWPSDLCSTAAPLPSSWSNSGAQVVEPDGLQVRTSQAATVKALVTEDILSMLAALAGEVAAIGAGIPSGSAVATPTATQLAAMSPTQYRTTALKSE